MVTSNEKELWSVVEKRLQDLLIRYSDEIDDESKEAVQHYLDHSEYEMAFEGLFIELMKLKVSLGNEESCGFIELGKKLDLDKESVFDGDFWNNFTEYYSKLG
jgi:hypothetical protein